MHYLIRKSLTHSTISTILIYILATQQCIADSGVVINNNTQAAPAQSSGSGCNNNQDNSQGMRPGVYYQSNPNGGINTDYTTGDKTPYNVDNSCNNPPPVQPYVYAPASPPGPPGPPGPKPDPHR